MIKTIARVIIKGTSYLSAVIRLYTFGKYLSTTTWVILFPAWHTTSCRLLHTLNSLFQQDIREDTCTRNNFLPSLTYYCIAFIACHIISRKDKGHFRQLLSWTYIKSHAEQVRDAAGEGNLNVKIKGFEKTVYDVFYTLQCRDNVKIIVVKFLDLILWACYQDELLNYRILVTMFFCVTH